MNTTYELRQQGDTASLKEHQQSLYVLLREFDRVCAVLGIRYFLFAGSLLGAVRHQGFIPWDDDLDVILLREDYERLLREGPDVLNKEQFYLQEEFGDHWPMFFSKLRLNGTTCLEKHHPKDDQIHMGVYMDIFPCDNACSGKLGRIFQFLCSKLIIANGLDARGYETDSLLKKILMLLCRHLPRNPVHRIVKGPQKRGSYVHSFLGGSSKLSKSVYPSRCFEEVVKLPFEDGVYQAPSGYDELLGILYGDYMHIPNEAERELKKHVVLVDLKKPYTEYEGYTDGMKFDVPIRSIR